MSEQLFFGITPERISQVCGVTLRTAKRYKSRGAAPEPVMRLLRYHLHGRILGKEWKGWSCKDDRLYSPNREEFTPGFLNSTFFLKQLARDADPYIAISKALNAWMARKLDLLDEGESFYEKAVKLNSRELRQYLHDRLGPMYYVRERAKALVGAKFQQVTDSHSQLGAIGRVVSYTHVDLGHPLWRGFALTIRWVHEGSESMSNWSRWEITDQCQQVLAAVAGGRARAGARVYPAPRAAQEVSELFPCRSVKVEATQEHYLDGSQREK